jgi:hypothetical protein
MNNELFNDLLFIDPFFSFAYCMQPKAGNAGDHLAMASMTDMPDKNQPATVQQIPNCGKPGVNEPDALLLWLRQDQTPLSYACYVQGWMRRHHYLR